MTTDAHVTPDAAELDELAAAELRAEAWREYLAAHSAYQALEAERGFNDAAARDAWRTMMKWHRLAGCCPSRF